MESRMILYVVYDYDDGIESVNSIYDEETFKTEYKKFLDRTGNDWGKWYYVVAMELNKDDDHNDYHSVNVKEIENERN
jgi:hypothetical protein